VCVCVERERAEIVFEARIPNRHHPRWCCFSTTTRHDGRVGERRSDRWGHVCSTWMIRRTDRIPKVDCDCGPDQNPFPFNGDISRWILLGVCATLGYCVPLLFMLGARATADEWKDSFSLRHHHSSDPGRKRSSSDFNIHLSFEATRQSTEGTDVSLPPQTTYRRHPLNMPRSGSNSNSSSSRGDTPAPVLVEDSRNLSWKQNNVGSKLLQKMGWKDGQAVGKRQRSDGATVTTEGLRIQKRANGLGLGASSVPGGIFQGSSHHEHFSTILATLKSAHAGSTPASQTDTQKKRRKTKVPTLPTNKTTHHKVRQAKFQTKTADDMKCIFGHVAGGADFPVIAAEGSSTRKAKKDSLRKKKKKEVE
jgi:hypothetical protein